MKRAKDRRQAPLEEGERLPFPRETDRTYNVTNFVKHIVPCETPGGGIGRIERLRIYDHEHTEHGRCELPMSADSPMPLTPRPLKSPLSPSIYSRNTDGISILPNESVMSLTRPEEHARRHDPGSALILTSQSARSYVVGTPSPPRQDPLRTSRDWKDWLSNEISGIDFTNHENLRIHEKYMTPPGQGQRNKIRTSHTEHNDTTVILKGTYDIASSTPDFDDPGSTENATTAEQYDPLDQPGQQNEPVQETSTAIQDRRSHSCSSQLSPTLLPNKQQLLSNSSSYTTPPQPAPETPKSSRINDRFPFIDTGRCSSASSSRKSKSPTGSIPSLKSPRSSKTTHDTNIYSNLSAAATTQTVHRIHNSASKEYDAQHKQKENMVPPSLRDKTRPNISILGTPSRPATSQSLSHTAVGCNTPSIRQYTINDSKTHSKHNSSPAVTPSRPHVRIALRPVSPEKLSRRPKSAYGIRNTNPTSSTQVAKKLSIGNLSTPSPCLPFERPRTALHLKTSSSSLALNKEPSPGVGQRVINSVLDDQRSDSATPGQRMADRSFKERSSTPLLEGVKMRGGLTLTREDTPAFL